jgi:ubiquitin C-terminal hydrolase
MIPQFRYSILSADDGEEADVSEVPEWFLKKTSSEKCLDNNLLHQLQHLYGFLELTDKQAYRPAGFCFAYKDYSGEPVNTSIQQDAQEFINFFLERLDKCLSSTLYKNLVSNTFKGKISNQIICNECRNVTERLEDFYNISLDVKHSKTIHESFSKFISGDTISGFNCESCQKQVDIKKRSLLHTLPNFMIVHLQRMVFNFDTMENEKINSRLEFPQDLNVFPYSTEGVDQSTAPEDYSYDLQGIIVHMGTAQAGHYYSFIKDGKRWLEFNDSTIKGFK